MGLFSEIIADSNISAIKKAYEEILTKYSKEEDMRKALEEFYSEVCYIVSD